MRATSRDRAVTIDRGWLCAHESRLARDFGTKRFGSEDLKTDNRAIFAAASHAQRAADFINGLQPASAG